MHKKPIILLFLSVVVFTLCFMLPGGGEPVEAQTDPPRVPPVRNVILKYNASADLMEASQVQSQVQMERLRGAAGIELSYFRPMSGDAHVLRLPERLPVDQAEEIARRLEALPEVAYAHPDYILTLMGETQATTMSTPDDPLYTSQWHYFAPGGDHYGVNAPAAWDITTGSASIVVAVIDTGYLDHPDLSGKWLPGYDMISDITTANDSNGRDPDAHDPGDWVAAFECGFNLAQDSSWHGTHVAGTIGALGNNGTGVAGLNWEAMILPVRVLGKCGGETSDVVDAIRWAVGLAVTGVPANVNPADVINISLGGYNDTGCDPSLQSAITDAYSAGTTIVVAAGNENDDASNYEPANCQYVITVAATDRNGDRAYYSNNGSVVEISAPGGAQEEENDPNGVLSTLNAGATSPGTYNYEYYQGTSMAAPHVAGIASLLLSYDPTLTPAQVLSILQGTVTPFPVGSGCNTSICGSGIVNAGAALASLEYTETVFLPVVLNNFTNLPPGDFGKVAPLNTASGQPNNPTLSWESSDRASSYEYCYDTSNDNNCTTWTSTGINTSVGLSGLLYDSTYYWQVRAKNSTGTTYADGSGTSYWSFTTETQPPGIVNGDFELGTYGWTESSSHGYPLILESAGLPITPHSGNSAAWLGGDDNEISYLEQQVTISAGAPYLVYWHWIESYDICEYDFGYVSINGSDVDVYDLCETANTGGWVTHSVNLSAYIGQTVLVQIRAETDDWVDSWSNLYVDDVSLQSSPAAIGPASGTIQDLGDLVIQSKIGIGLLAHQLPGLLDEPVFDSPER